MTAVLTPASTALTRRDDDAIDRPASEVETVFVPSSVTHDDAPSVGNPMDSLIDQWVALAVRHARVRRVDDLYVADVAGLAGPWADGDTLGGAIASLTEVLADWVVLKLERGDTNIPPMEGVKLVLDDEPS